VSLPKSGVSFPSHSVTMAARCSQWSIYRHPNPAISQSFQLGAGQSHLVPCTVMRAVRGAYPLASARSFVGCEGQCAIQPTATATLTRSAEIRDSFPYTAAHKPPELFHPSTHRLPPLTPTITNAQYHTTRPLRSHRVSHLLPVAFPPSNTPLPTRLYTLQYHRCQRLPSRHQITDDYADTEALHPATRT